MGFWELNHLEENAGLALKMADKDHRVVLCGLLGLLCDGRGVIPGWLH